MKLTGSNHEPLLMTWFYFGGQVHSMPKYVVANASMSTVGHWSP